MGDPVGALRRARHVLADDGVVLLAEHAGSGKLEENLHPAGRFFYAASALVCVPNALSGEVAKAPLGSIPENGRWCGSRAQPGSPGCVAWRPTPRSTCCWSCACDQVRVDNLTVPGG